MSPAGPRHAEPLESRRLLSGDFAAVIAAGASGSDRGNAIDVDAGGNSLIAGVFNQTVDFDPSAGSARLTAPSPNSAFVAKYSQAGGFLWARGLGGSGEQNIQGIGTDSGGNVYAAGYFSGVLDADPGSGYRPIAARGQHDGFVLKLTAAGAFVWAKALGGTAEEGCTALDVDAAGNAYAVTMFAGSGDYDPGPATRTLTPHGSYDVALTKLDSAGNLKYALSFGGSGEDYGNGVSVDGTGRAAVAATIRASVDADPGPGTHVVTSAGGADVLVLGVDAGGAFRFASRVGGPGNDQAGDVRTDPSGNAVVVGQFTGTADFDPSAAFANVSSAGSADAFVAKFSPTGASVWARRVGGTSADRATNIAIDASGSVYVTGQFGGTADFDPGGQLSHRTAVGGQDLFVLKLTSGGTYAWSRTAGGAWDDVGEGIAVDGSGAVDVVGAFAGRVDFDPSAAVAQRTAAGGYDWFWWKLTGS